MKAQPATIVFLLALIVAMVLRIANASAAHPVLECLPPIESKELREIFADEWTLFYDAQSMPRVTQNFGEIVSAKYEFNHNEPGTTNPNNEYPWKIGGGMHAVDSRDILILKFYWHPEHRPIKVFRTVRHNGFANVVRERAWDWEFPVDSVIGEIITLRWNDAAYPFEIRLLTRDADAWQPRVFRQHNEVRELADAIWHAGYHDVASYIGNMTLRHRRLIDRLHNPPIITVDVAEVELPELPDELVEQLLNSPIREVTYASELTSSVSQIIPAGYRPALVGIEREDCRKCHQHVGLHAMVIDADRRRDWYSYQSGSGKDSMGGGIFSFHPFAGLGPVRLNQRLISSGHVAPYRGGRGY